MTKQQTEELLAAIAALGGNAMRCSRCLGIPHRTLMSWIAGSQELQDALCEAREQRPAQSLEELLWGTEPGVALTLQRTGNGWVCYESPPQDCGTSPQPASPLVALATVLGAKTITQ